MGLFSDVLRLPMAALRERIDQELQENPVLTITDPEASDEDTGDEDIDVDVQALREGIEQDLKIYPGLDFPGPAPPAWGAGDEEVDVVVDRSDAGGHLVRLPDHGYSHLGICPEAVALARDPAVEPQTQEYLDRKLRRARRLLEAIEQRRSTLRAVAEAVFRRQRAFLDRGPGHLARLQDEEVAGDAGTDAVTVLRALRGKRVRTPYGVFALADFVARRPGPSAN